MALPFKDFNSKDELLIYYTDKFGEDCSQGLFYSALTTAPLNFIYNDQIQGWIEKHIFCKQYNIAPFIGSYEEIPAYWIDFVKLFDIEIINCQKESERKHGKSVN